MKKAILVPAILGVMGIGGAIAVYGDQLIGSANNEKVLTLEQIEQKALAEVKGVIRDVEFDRNAITSYYDVEVVAVDAEYDLKFDAVTGNLLSKKKDWLDFDDDYYESNASTSQQNVTTINETKVFATTNEVPAKTTTQKPAATQNVAPVQATSTKVITQEQAIQIALGKVNGTVTSVEFDDGYQYEIEIIKDQFDYDFDIDAATGAIIKLEKEGLYD